MRNVIKELSVLLVVLALSLSIPGTAFATGGYGAYAQRGPVSPSPSAMAFDGLVVRPLGVAATLIGGVTYVLTLPFSLLGGNAGEAGAQLVGSPAKFTFQRPLGEFPRGAYRW